MHSRIVQTGFAKPTEFGLTGACRSSLVKPPADE